MNETQFQERGQFLERASVEASNAGVRALLLLNGGACVAMLGFIAGVFPHDNLDTDRARFLSAAIQSLVYFASAAGLSVMASLIAYLANQAYATAHIRPHEYDAHWCKGTVWNRIGILVVVAAMALFAVGVFKLWRAV